MKRNRSQTFQGGSSITETLLLLATVSLFGLAFLPRLTETFSNRVAQLSQEISQLDGGGTTGIVISGTGTDNGSGSSSSDDGSGSDDGGESVPGPGSDDSTEGDGTAGGTDDQGGSDDSASAGPDSGG